MNRAAVDHLEKQMQRTDVRMDQLALQVGDIEKNIFAEENGEVEVDNLLKSVNEVRHNYQNLRKEISEVQDLQRQLSSSLQLQIRMMQSKFNTLKEKIVTNVPEASISSSVASSLNQLTHVNQFQHVNVNEHMGMDPMGGHMDPMSSMSSLATMSPMMGMGPMSHHQMGPMSHHPMAHHHQMGPMSHHQMGPMGHHQMGPMSPMPNLLLDVPELPDKRFRHY